MPRPSRSTSRSTRTSSTRALWLSREELQAGEPAQGRLVLHAAPRFDRPPPDRGMARPRGRPVDQRLTPKDHSMTAQLFTPVELGGVTLPNRIVVSPMCQYSAVDGSAQPWHQVHYGMLAMSGAGPAVPRGDACRARGPHHPGLPRPLQRRQRGGAEARRRLGARLDAAREARHPARPCRPQGLGAAAVEGRRAAHPGRRARPAVDDVSRPRRSRFDAKWHTPVALDAVGLKRVKQAFVDATLRSAAAGLRRDRAARRARLLPQPVPVAAQQPSQRRVWRHHGEAPALPARGVRGLPPAVAARQGAGHPAVAASNGSRAG